MPYVNPSCWKRTKSQDKRDVKCPERSSKQEVKGTLPRGRATLRNNKLKKDTTNYKTDSGAIIEKQYNCYLPSDPLGAHNNIVQMQD